MTQGTTMTTSVQRDRIFAGGEWISPAARDELVVENPVDFSEVGRTPDASAQDVDVAVRAAREAFDHGPWPKMTFAERAEWMFKLADEMERRGAETSALITDEIGQPVRLSRPWGQIIPVNHVRYYANIAKDYEEEEVRPNVRREGTSIIRKEPLGVAALIVPWNHPQASTTLKLAPALAAGCTVVLKPAEETPLDAYHFAEASVAIGMPPGVINIVPGGRETGRALVAHPGVDKVSFTGSAEAGKQIASVAGARLIPVTLELGGKSAAIVLESADLDEMFASLRNVSFDNTGQTCALLSRVVVPRSLYGTVRDRLVDLARDLRVGDPDDEATELGPLVSKRIYERVTGLVDTARAQGATILAGDTPLPDVGYFVAPTIVDGVSPDSLIAQEEVFGPVVTILPYDGLEQAIEIANNSRYGLAGAVYGDPDEVLPVARRIRTGSIGLNGYRPDLNHPYGGYKESGLGREFGPEAIGNFQETKSIWR
ncbi:aldehyde dehydrogenase [Agromyces bauzanensis]